MSEQALQYREQQTDRGVTVDKLREWFAYDPISGVVSWRKKPNRNMPVGQPAGHLFHREPYTSYRRITLNGRPIFAHVVAFALMTGRFPKGSVDHCNGNGLDNRWANLRPATPEINGRNQRRRTQSGAERMGVDFHAASGKWRARITIDQKPCHLGVFHTKAEAVAERLAAERRHGFHADHGREA